MEKKIKKKFICWICLVCMMLMVLAGCGSAAEQPGVSGAVADAGGSEAVGDSELISMMTRGCSDVDKVFIQEQIDEGQWIYRKGEDIAVVTKSSPVKVMISHDGGKEWEESVIEGSDTFYFNGEERKDFTYEGSFIGFNTDGSGYLVLTTGVSMGSQDGRIFVTSDNGKSWSEAGNLNDIHRAVVTGAGLSPEGILFMSYRYYEDNGPDIWCSEDMGKSWNSLEYVKTELGGEVGYRYNALSPTFEQLNGTYPIERVSADSGEKEMLYLKSKDGGKNWE